MRDLSLSIIKYCVSSASNTRKIVFSITYYKSKSIFRFISEISDEKIAGVRRTLFGQRQFEDTCIATNIFMWFHHNQYNSLFNCWLWFHLNLSLISNETTIHRFYCDWVNNSDSCCSQNGIQTVILFVSMFSQCVDISLVSKRLAVLLTCDVHVWHFYKCWLCVYVYLAFERPNCSQYRKNTQHL